MYHGKPELSNGLSAFILMYHGKPELSNGLSAFICLVRRVNLPSSDSSWTLTFCFGFIPRQLYFLLPHVRPCLMPIGLNLNLENRIPGPTAALVLHAPKHAFKAFSGLAFFDGRIFLHDIDEMTWYLPHFCPTYIYVKKS